MSDQKGHMQFNVTLVTSLMKTFFFTLSHFIMRIKLNIILCQNYYSTKPPSTNCNDVMKLHCINPFSPNSDLSQISHCSFKGLSVMKIENMITEDKFS